MNAYAIILVYDKHTAKEFKQEEIFNDYRQIKGIEQGELRNPLVEQLINETLAVVKDVWKRYQIKPDEIHVELSRDLKNNAERRARIYKANRENQNANDDIKSVLSELQKETSMANIEKYKLWISQENLSQEFTKQFSDPSKSEIEKMKLWKEQGHISPYTGQTIPLSELFDKSLYDIDHIIPQSRYFDDSLSNKIICERQVNKDKGNKTAMEYFETGSSTQTILGKEEFIDHVNKSFQGIKRKNLLATKVPEDPIERQIKETQYVSIRVKEELNKIVGNKNVKTSTGGITDYLRHQWGLTDKFKNVLKSRYENIQPALANEEYDAYLKLMEEKKKELEKLGLPFTEPEPDKENYLTQFKENYIKYKNNKLVITNWTKRIDHRHHAIDALVVACTKTEHIQRLNNLNKELQNWIDKRRKELLPDFEGSPSEFLDEILSLEPDKQKKIFTQIQNFRNIDLPWNGFPEEAAQKINEIIVSHKPKDKLVIQNDKEGKSQLKIRGQLHESTLYGKSQGVESYRISLSKLAGKKFATEKTIEKITNPYLKKVVSEHLKEFDEKKEEAFSAEGILNLNKKLAIKKNKKGEVAPHTPISSIKIFYRDPIKIKKKKGQEEPDDALQKLDREKAFNKSLYVSTGGNYLFAVMEKDGKRVFDIITFFDAVNLLKQEFNKEPNKKLFNKDLVFKNYFEQENKAKLLFTLKQNEIVYLPANNEEIITDHESLFFNQFWNNKSERSKNIYVVQKFSTKGNEIYFLNHTIASMIKKKIEFDSQDAYQNIFGKSIKTHCIKLNVDRLGNISPEKNNYRQPASPSKNITSEPEPIYQKINFQTFLSHEESNEAVAQAGAQISPEEHLRNTTQIIKGIYADELKTTMDKDLKFKKDD